MYDIAAAAGITGPAVYRHFPDKQAVLFHVLRHALDDVWATTTAAASTVDDLLPAVAATTIEQRGLAALWRWEGRHLSQAQQRELRQRSNAVLAAWTKVLLAARPGLAPEDAELLCWAAFSVFGSVSVHQTTVARQRFVALLAGIAGRVLYARLPEPGDDPDPGPSPVPLGSPSRREQVLTAATELFHRHGFHAVSMDDIGAAAGIAGPSVYRHFAGKTAILCAIARRAADRLAAGAEQALRTSTGEREALHRLVVSYVDVLTGSPELAVSFLINTANLAEQESAELVRVQRDYVARWAGLLAATRPELQEREARITVRAALTIANDLVRTRRLAGRAQLPAELAVLMLAALGLDR